MAVMRILVLLLCAVMAAVQPPGGADCSRSPDNALYRQKTCGREWTRINSCLEADWTEHDLGRMQLGETRECDLHLKNVSDSTMHISYLAPGCRCIKLSCHVDAIRPAETATVHIEYDSSGHSPGHTEQSMILCLEGHDSPIYFILKADLCDH